MILVFDLDDTLYPEISYVYSGFRAVAEFIEDKYKVSVRDTLPFMKSYLTQYGRGHVFNECLSNYDINPTRKAINELIHVYRFHDPTIRLPIESRQCLQRFSHYAKYVVTDGNKVVQLKKLKALDLYDTSYFKKCYITHRYGRSHAKPSSYCFWDICRNEDEKPWNVVYIGDNPNKDFVGIKPEGFRTIRILQGEYKALVVDESMDADCTVGSLNELTEDFLRNFKMRMHE
jgi:putative hydrolase of the HAD superfamily